MPKSPLELLARARIAEYRERALSNPRSRNRHPELTGPEEARHSPSPPQPEPTGGHGSVLSPLRNRVRSRAGH